MKRLFFLGAIVFAAGFAFWRHGHRQERFRHVFVNQTSNHRFDESIQTSIMSAYTRTGVQNAVVITDLLPVESAQATRLFSDLGLGRATHGRAILYFYSPRLKSLKIEVGYALEGVIPDVTVHRLEMAAKSFIFSEHYQDFWAELINTLNIEIYNKEHGVGQTDAFDFSRLEFVSGGGGTLSHLYEASAERLAEESKKIPTDQTSHFTADPEIKVSLNHYLESLHAGIGDERLPVLNSESRIFRGFWPTTTYQLFRNWQMYSDAGVDRIFQDDGFAFVFFHSDHPVLPLVFVRGDKGWEVQEPLSWSLFQRFEDSMRVFMKYPLRIKSPELNTYLSQTFGQPLYSRSPVDLRQTQGDLFYFYFRLYCLDRVANDLAKQDLTALSQDQLWMDLDTQNNLGRFSEFLRVMRELVKRRPKDTTLLKRLQFYEQALQFSGPQWQLTLD